MLELVSSRTRVFFLVRARQEESEYTAAGDVMEAGI